MTLLVAFVLLALVVSLFCSIKEAVLLSVTRSRGGARARRFDQGKA
jgi:hypothetical protein